MNGTSPLQSRSHNNDLIERAFIKKILKEEAGNISQAQERVLNRAPNEPRIDLVKSSRSFVVSDDQIKHTHNIQQRFIDMKRTRYGKQKPVKVHNSIIYSHFNNILFRLKTNLTESLRAQISQQLNIELYG